MGDQFEAVYENYLSKQMDVVAGKNRRNKKLQWIRANYPKSWPASREAKILEIGPGLGELLEYLTGELKYTRYQAIDMSPEVVDRCNQLAPNSTSLCQDSEAFLRERVGEFDQIVMFHVLEHTPRDRLITFTRALYAALAPGGRLLVEVPNALNMVTGPYFSFGELTHEWHFTTESLSQALRIGGFENIRMGGCRVPLTSPARWLHFALQSVLNGLQVILLRAYLPTYRPVVAHTMWAFATK